MHSFSEIPGYVTRFCGKKKYLSLAVFTDSLECMYCGEGEGKGRGRGRDSDTFLNKRQAKVFQSGTTQVDGNEVQVT